MVKTLGSVLRLLFGLFILCLVGYNTMQVAALRAEVAELKRARAAAVEKYETVAPSGPLTRARKHAEQAQAFLRTKEYAAAQREIAAATQALRQASQNAQSGG